MGVEGAGITVPPLGDTKLRLGDEMITGQLLYVPNAGTNLLGRGLMMKLGIQIVNRYTGITVLLMECSQALTAKIYSPLTGKTLKWGRKQQYRWTVLPQGFTGPPIYLGKVLEQILELFQPPKEVLLSQKCG